MWPLQQMEKPGWAICWRRLFSRGGREKKQTVPISSPISKGRGHSRTWEAGDSPSCLHYGPLSMSRGHQHADQNGHYSPKRLVCNVVLGLRCSRPVSLHLRKCYQRCWDQMAFPLIWLPLALAQAPEAPPPPPFQKRIPLGEARQWWRFKFWLFWLYIKNFKNEYFSLPTAQVSNTMHLLIQIAHTMHCVMI